MPTQRLPRQVSLEPLRTQRYRILPVPDVAFGPCPPTECTPTVVWTDTFGMDDLLQVIYRVPFPDTFALTEGGLGVFVGLFDTLGADDRLTLAQAVTRHVDTFGIDDRLSLTKLVVLLTETLGLNDALIATIKNYFLDTFGLDDRLTLVDMQANFTDTIGMVDGALGVAVKVFETLGMDDRLTFVDLLTTYADSFGIADSLTLVTIATVYADTLGLDDRLSFVDLFTNQLDTVGVAETSLDPKVTVFDTVAATDNLFADLDAVWIDSIGHDDALSSALIANWTCGRSGTPDTDPCGDGWIDQASVGTNHGNETPIIAKGKSTLANDERRGVIEFDFTRYSGMSAHPAGTHNVVLRVTNTSALLAVDLGARLSRHAVRPFTESTITWTASDPAGTLIRQATLNIAANTTVNWTIVLTTAELNDILASGWLALRLTTPTAAAPISVNIVSREGATVSERPRLAMELRR